MTKKDYELIAGLLNEAYKQSWKLEKSEPLPLTEENKAYYMGRNQAIQNFAGLFVEVEKRNNPKFSEAMFWEAVYK